MLLIISLLNNSAREKAEWKIFKINHDCQLVGVSQGHAVVGSGVGVGPNGQAAVVTTTNFIPDTKSWLCDNGVTYTREK